MITYDINVLIGAEDSTKKALVKCNDSGVNLHVFLKTRKKLSDVRFEDTAYVIPANSTAVLKINKVDNTYVLVDGPASSDSVFFEMPPQAFTAVGVHTAEVSIYGSDGRRITSADFFIETTSECISDTSVESETYIDILADQIKAVKDAEANATAAATHPPVVGDNGNYQIWDSKTGEYIDSGIVAFVNGASAYEIALAHGYEGTEEEWLISLQGKEGKEGPAGYTPQKGIDYYTPEDKEAIVNDVLAEVEELTGITAEIKTTVGVE